jgi:DNA-directed RNA polymerase specialized sigma24 family protein
MTATRHRHPLRPGEATAVPSEGSVSQWLGRLRAGEQAAAQPLWERYFRRLVALARARLKGGPRRVADEEDVALSAFHSFCRAAERGRFPQLSDRDDLWHLLVVLTARKACDLLRREGRHKRGGGRTPDPGPARPGEPDPLEQALGREPTPEFAAQVAEECRRLLALLGDRELEEVALAKMEGYTTEEIARRQGRTTRTVERKLRLIRDIWEAEGGPA